jgi:SET domain-containing protein
MLPYLVIAPSEKRGRGVFTTEPIAAETTVEISPVIVLTSDERIAAEKTLLYYYIFEWDEESSAGALGLGYISMYNHSYHSNCKYEMDFDTQTMEIITVKDILKGEELFINYNADPDDETPIWFKAK